MSDEPDKLTNYRLEMIEKTLTAVNENLERLASLEAKHIETREGLGRAFDAIDRTNSRIDEQNDRMRAVELEMPTLKLVRNWIITGVMAVIGILGAVMVKFFVMAPV